MAGRDGPSKTSHQGGSSLVIQRLADWQTDFTRARWVWMGASPCLKVIRLGKHQADPEQLLALMLGPCLLAQRLLTDMLSCCHARRQGTAQRWE